MIFSFEVFRRKKARMAYWLPLVMSGETIAIGGMDENHY
jgi:hypothetical protein